MCFVFLYIRLRGDTKRKGTSRMCVPVCRHHFRTRYVANLFGSFCRVPLAPSPILSRPQARFRETIDSDRDPVLLASQPLKTSWLSFSAFFDFFGSSLPLPSSSPWPFLSFFEFAWRCRRHYFLLIGPPTRLSNVTMTACLETRTRTFGQAWAGWRSTTPRC